eukprot:TRINITY_DN11468_c0_g2_i1.p1 TRINITY_DN11468_c0_g2~~TRINITY_DN11468_c0_g2_i1.p1  ORF type:complete len:862 (-),score=145.20 TRINITY_DN11468_c0_g2_i1:76-2661(-)
MTRWLAVTRCILFHLLFCNLAGVPATQLHSRLVWHRHHTAAASAAFANASSAANESRPVEPGKKLKRQRLVKLNESATAAARDGGDRRHDEPGSFENTADLDLELDDSQIPLQGGATEERADQLPPVDFDVTDVDVSKAFPAVKETPGEVSGIKPNNYGDTGNLKIVVIFSSCMTGIILFGAWLLRCCTPAMFTRLGGPIQDRSIMGYARELYGRYNCDADNVIQVAGLDAWMLLELYGMVWRILIMVGPVLIIVLLPLHYNAEGNPVHADDLLSRLDMGNVPLGSRSYWVHAVCVWYFVVVSTWNIDRAHDGFLKHRFAWISALTAPRATTLLVENIPAQYCSDRALKQYFVSLFGENAVERAYIVRKTRSLRAAQERVESLDYKLQQLGANAGPLDCDCGPRPETASSLRRQRAEAYDELEDIHRVVERGASSYMGNPAVCASSGFVTFSSKLWRRLAEKEQFRADASEFATTIPPDPDDLIYTDLKRNKAEHYSAEAIGTICIVILFLFWAPVVVLISGLTTFETVQESIPAVTVLKNRYPGAGTFMESFFASATMKLFMALLPCILFNIIVQFFTSKAHSWAQLRLERWYITFLMTFVVLITMVGRSLLITMVAFAAAPGEKLILLAQSLPGASHFYIQYVALDWFSTTFQLMRHGVVFNYWLNRLFRGMESDVAKSAAEPESQSFFGMGARVGHGVLLTTIAFVLCTCSPVINVFALVSMTVGRIVYSFLLVTVETKKADTGGLFWVEALKQIYFAIFLYIVLMTAILTQKQAPGPAMLAGGSFFVFYQSFDRFSTFVWERLPLEQVAAESRGDKAMERYHEQGRGGVYVQRECILPPRQPELSAARRDNRLPPKK